MIVEVQGASGWFFNFLNFAIFFFFHFCRFKYISRFRYGFGFSRADFYFSELVWQLWIGGPYSFFEEFRLGCPLFYLAQIAALVFLRLEISEEQLLVFFDD